MFVSFVELGGYFFDRAFAGGGVDVHGCGDVCMAEGVLQILWVDVLLNGYCSVAVAKLVGGAGNADVLRISLVEDVVALLVQGGYSTVIAEDVMLRV